MALTIKVEYGAAAKAYRFNADQTFVEVIKSVKEKTGAADDIKELGVYQPADGMRPGRWLRLDKTIQYYDLKNNDTVLLKKRARPLKLRMIDGTTKTVMVDDSITMVEIVDIVGEKLAIANPEEYSLAKLDGTWLLPTQSLGEQGVDEKDVLMLKKKFFVTDANIDRNDPMQMHMLFVQCRDNITTGRMPCSYDEAIKLAAMTLQSEYGNIQPQKYDKKGCLKDIMKNLIAPQHTKQYAKCEADIIAEWKKLIGTSEGNAKFRFLSTCRGLKTYGITCYIVQQRAPRGKKLEEVMIGITKDHIYRMDPETKEITKSNKITELRRWAASPKSFTFDFGDYEGDYYTVITVEGESMSQLIAGYIDILLKRRKDMGKVEEADDSSMAAEELVAPIRSAPIATTWSGIGYDPDAEMRGQDGMLSPGMQRPGIGGVQGQTLGGRMGQAQKAGLGPNAQYITDIDSCEDAINQLLEGLEEDAPWMRMKSELTPEQWRQKLQEAMLATGKTMEEVLKNAQKGNKSALNAQAKGIFQNVQDLIRAAQMAGLGGEDDVSLLEGARLMSEAVKNLLRCAKDLAENPNDPAAQARLAEAARVLQAAQVHMAQAMKGSLLSDPISEELILASSKAVSSAANQLKDIANDAASKVPNANQREALTTAAENEAQSGEFLYVMHKMLAGVINAPGAKAMAEETARGLQSRLGELMKYAKMGITDPSLLDRIARATKDVNDAVAQLMLANDCAATMDLADIPYHAKKIDDNTEVIATSQGQKAEIVKAINEIARSGVWLSSNAPQTAKLLADPAQQQKLLASAKALSEHTNAAIAAGKIAASDPNDNDAYRKLLEASKRVRDAAIQLVGDSGKAVQFRALQTAAKQIAAATTDLVYSSKGSLNKMKPNATHGAELEDSANRANGAIERLLQAVKKAHLNPDSLAAQNELLTAATAAAIPSAELTAAAKESVPEVDDLLAKRELNDDATAASKALQDLMLANKRAADALGAREMENAIQEADAAASAMDVLILNAEVGGMAEPQGNLDQAMRGLTTAAQQLTGVAQGVRDAAVSKPDNMGPASRQVGPSVGQLANAAKAVAQASGDKSVQVSVLSNAKMAAIRVKDQVTAARAKLYNPSDKQATEELEAAQQALKDALAGLVSAASGADVAAKECDEAINAISNDMENIDAAAPPPGYEWGRAGEDLEKASKALSVALNQVALAAKQNPKNLGMNAKLAQAAFREHVQAVNAAIGATQSPAAKSALASNAENTGKAAIRLLTAAKLARQDPGRVDKAVADVTAALQALAAAADQATPGHDDLVAAMEAIREALARLGQADPERDQQANRKLLNDSATELGETVGQMSVAAHNQTEKLGPQAMDAAAALRGVLLAAGGLSPDVLDLTNAVDRIQEQFEKLGNVNTVIPATKEIAKASSAVVNQARYYITTNPDTDPALKRELIDSAQALATLTSQLAAEAKNWQADPTGSDDAGIKSLQKDMVARLNALRAINHKLTSKARSSPLLMNAARALAEAATGLIKTLKTVAARPKDAAAQSAMSGSISQVTDGIKKVLDASTSLVPGQRECDEAIAKLSVAASELASAAMQAAVGVFSHQLPRGKSAQEVQEEVVDLAKELLQSTNAVIEAAFKNQTAIGPTVSAIARAIAQLVEATKNSAATSTDATVQQTRLNGSKALADATLALVKAVKTYTATPNPTVQAQLIEHARECTAAIGNIIQSMKPNVLGLRQCDEAIAAIVAAERILDQNASPAGQSYQEVRNKLGAVAKELIIGISALLKDAQLGNFDLVGADSMQTADNITRLNEVTIQLAAVVPEAGVKPKLIGGGRAVTRATATMARNAKALTEDNKNATKIAQLSNSFNQTTEAIRLLMAGIKEGARGERDCEQALEEIKKLNGILEAAALFAGTGQLAGDLEAGKTLEDYHILLTRSAADMRREAHNICQASSNSVEEVGAAAKAMAKALSGVTKGSKGSAALLSNEDSQRTILTAAKAIGTATQEIVQASKELQTVPQGDSADRQANGKEALELAVAQLTEAANLASSQIIDALRQIDNGKTGILAAVSAIDHSPGNTSAKADDIGVAARKIVAANQDALAALQANNWEVLGPAASQQAEAAAEMLNATKGVLADPRTNKKIGAEAMEAAKAAALAEAKFMDAVKFQRDDAESQERVRVANDEIMAKLQAFITVARGLPDGADLDLNEDQLAKLAEQELLNAAKQIEAAAARIMTVQASNVDDQLPEALKQAEVTEAILEAARAITRAAAGLVQAATVSQKELAAKGRADRSANPYKKDPAWAQGLISAAREVAGTVDQLVNSANDAAQKKAGEEHLVASTRQVAAAVARLQAASKAKADPSSPSQQKLELAAKSVGSATAKVVDAAKAFTYVEDVMKAKDRKEDLSEAAQKRREYEAKAEIDRIEQSLSKARQALLQGRKDAYADARGEARRPGAKR